MREEYVSECCGANNRQGSTECPFCNEDTNYVLRHRYYAERKEPAQYSYAPTQKEITTWIKRVAFGRI